MKVYEVDVSGHIHVPPPIPKDDHPAFRLLENEENVSGGAGVEPGSPRTHGVQGGAPAEVAEPATVYVEWPGGGSALRTPLVPAVLLALGAFLLGLGVCRELSLGAWLLALGAVLLIAGMWLLSGLHRLLPPAGEIPVRIRAELPIHFVGKAAVNRTAYETEGEPRETKR
jgi:hypothetical protein